MAIRPSPRLAILLLLSHALAAFAMHLTAMPPAARLALLAPVLLSLFHYLARDALLLSAGSWREVSFGPDCATVLARNGSRFSGKVSGKTVVTPFLIVLCVVPEGRRLPVCRAILPDALDAEEFRDLRVRLKFSQ